MNNIDALTAEQADLLQKAGYPAEEGMNSEDLDEIVHEAKAEEAAAINNGGLQNQVDYLCPQPHRITVLVVGSDHIILYDGHYIIGMYPEEHPGPVLQAVRRMGALLNPERDVMESSIPINAQDLGLDPDGEWTWQELAETWLAAHRQELGL